jgi:hypothetical protein
VENDNCATHTTMPPPRLRELGLLLCLALAASHAGVASAAPRAAVDRDAGSCNFGQPTRCGWGMFFGVFGFYLYFFTLVPVCQQQTHGLLLGNERARRAPAGIRTRARLLPERCSPTTRLPPLRRKWLYGGGTLGQQDEVRRLIEKRNWPPWWGSLVWRWQKQRRLLPSSWK